MQGKVILFSAAIHFFMSGVSNLYNVGEESMMSSWKFPGLMFSIALEVLFWVLYLSLLLVRIGSPLGDILWLAGGALGIIFGIINLIGCQKRHIRTFSIIALVLGIIQLPLWALAMLVTSM